MHRLLLLLMAGLASGAVWVGAGLPPRVGIAIAIPARAPGIVLVPAAALATGPAVWVVEKEAVYRRAVTTGATGPEHVEVLRGLAVGQAVILFPPPDLREGQPIRLEP